MIGIARGKDKHAHFPSILAATTAEWTLPGLEEMVSVLPLLPSIRLSRIGTGWSEDALKVPQEMLSSNTGGKAPNASTIMDHLGCPYPSCYAWVSHCSGRNQTQRSILWIRHILLDSGHVSCSKSGVVLAVSWSMRKGSLFGENDTLKSWRWNR